MKTYKVLDVIKMLKRDGRELVAIRGSYRQFKHPSKSGKVTVNGKESKELDQFILNSIWKQAGWK